MSTIEAVRLTTLVIQNRTEQNSSYYHLRNDELCASHAAVELSLLTCSLSHAHGLNCMPLARYSRPMLLRNSTLMYLSCADDSRPAIAVSVAQRDRATLFCLYLLWSVGKHYIGPVGHAAGS